jgi:translocation and assembly module TamA
VVSLAEQTHRTIDFGASYATTEGLGLDARWTRYNLLGRADTLAIIARVSQLDSRIGPTLTLPDWWPGQTLTLTAQGYRTTTPAYDETGVLLRAERQRRFTATSYITFGVSADGSRTQELTPGVLTSLGRDLGTFTVYGDFYLDRSNDPLDPRQGWRIGLRAEPTLVVGGVNLPYLRVVAQASGYLPLDSSQDTVVASRIRVGSLFNGTFAEVPASQRFYAGGGGSVRGFGYQEVGPRFSNNAPEGGVSLIETSFELRHRLTQKWELATFIDAGNVGAGLFPGFRNMSVGAGVGVRYNLGFGPIRVDVATPVTNSNGGSPIQVYVSIGQSF